MIRIATIPLFFSFYVVAQQIKLVQGSIEFTSNAQLELIKASSDKLTGLLDLADRQFAFRLEIRSFQGFNSNLQREHFNENYMESTKFPAATFAGKIIEAIDFTVNGEYDVRAKGDLIIHGKSQVRIIKVRINISKDRIQVESKFKVPLADHDISIPRIVSQKIATEIDVVMTGAFPGK